MKAYLTYKNQIQGLKDVSETVKTTEKIAASSVHQLKIAVSNLQAYEQNIVGVLSRLSEFYKKNSEHELIKKHLTEKKAIIIVTGDNGLVGGLWHDVVSSFLAKVNDYQAIIVIGTKGKAYLTEENISFYETFNGMTDIPLQTEIDEITKFSFDSYITGKFSRVDILFPKFVSIAQQQVAVVPFLPFVFSDKDKLPATQNTQATGLPLAEPSMQQVFDRLLQKYIAVYFHKVALEAKLSELSARTVAMEHANTKTKDLIQKLDLTFKKERHRITTQRQIESFAAHKVL